MIFAKGTPNNAGVAIYGDCKDFEALNEAFYNITGNEEEFLTHKNAKVRVLAICYDIRHALMGEREIEFIDNGMNREQKMRMSVIAPDKNVYLKINILWPEMLFVTMVLNDFVRLYARKRAKNKYDAVMDKQNIWDKTVANVRIFQAAVAKCLKETVSEVSFRRMMSLMNKDYTWFDGYATQYIDILNCRFIDMDNEKRLKNIPIMAKRLAETGDEYQRLKAEVIAMAKKYNATEEDIIPKVDYPEHIGW